MSSRRTQMLALGLRVANRAASQAPMLWPMAMRKPRAQFTWWLKTKTKRADTVKVRTMSSFTPLAWIRL